MNCDECRHILKFKHDCKHIVPWGTIIRNHRILPYRLFSETDQEVMRDRCCFTWAPFTFSLANVVKMWYSLKELAGKMSNDYKHLTIMPIPAPAWARERSPSDRLSVRQRPTMAVSAERRLMSSPVRVLSKNPTSCFRIEEKRDSRNFRTICCPVTVEKGL